MLLIGLIALALTLVPGQAHAGPIFTAIFVAIGMSAFWAGVASAIVTTIISMAISYAVSSLLKPSSSARTRGDGTQQPVIDNKINVRQPTAPRQVIYGEARVGGVFGFMHTTNSNKYLHVVILMAGHEVHQFAQVWIGDEAFVTYENAGSAVDGDLVIDVNGFVPSPSQFAGKVRVRPFKGAPGQTIDADLLSECSDVLTSGDTFAGMAGLYVRLEFDQAIFRDIPNITAVIKGKKDIFDPRTDTTGWSVNSALIAANYLCDPVYGLGVDYATGIDEAALIAAANACDEQVDLAAGGQQSRFESYGSFKSSDTPKEVLGRLLGAMRGRAPFDGERWRILAGVYQTPTITLTLNEIRPGGVKIQTLTSRRDRFNAVKGIYIDPVRFWQEADFPPVVSDSYATIDGESIYRDIMLPFTRHAAMAQRIAKIDLLLSRHELRVTLRCNLSAWRVQAGDTVYVTLERYGWTSKVFEVRSTSFSVEDNALCVDLELAETSAEAYDWATSEEVEVDPNDGTTGPDANTVAPPTNLTVTEETYSTGAGSGVKSRLLIDWDPSPDGFLLAYQVEMKLQSVTDWDQTHILGRTATTETHWTVEDVAVGLYHVRVAAINTVERRSTFIQESVTVSGDTTPPEDVTGFTQIAGISGFSNFHWNGATQQRVRDGGATIIKYQAVTSGADWASGGFVFVGDGITQDAVLQTQIGTFMIKFQSATGVQSVNFASIVISTMEQPKVGIAIVNGLPASDLWEGQIVYDEATEKLWRYVVGTGWTTAVPTTDLTGQVTDAQIADMAAAKMTGQIVSTQITDDAVTTPKLAAGSVVTAKIAAGSITAEKMLIGNFENNVANPNFVNGLSNWGQLSGTYDTWISTMPTDISLLTGTGGYAGSQHVLQFAATYDFTSDGPLYNSSFFSVTAGEKYLLRTATQRITGGGTHVRDLTIELQFFRYDTTTSAWVFVTPTDPAYTQALDSDPANTWVVRDSNTYHAADNITVPATATRARVAVYSEAGGSVGGLYWLGLVSVFKRNPAALIVDGGIIAQTIATDAVTTNKVQAGAITSAKISVSQLSAISADVGSLTAGTITGLTVRTGSGSSRIEMTSGGSYPNAITAYVGGTAVATFAGNDGGTGGFLAIVGDFSAGYPARFQNTSTTGGGGGLGGGAITAISVGGYTISAVQSASGAGTPLPTTAITGENTSGGDGHIGRSSGAGSWAFYDNSGTGYGPFTGAHDGLLPLTVEPEPGDLLVDGPVVRKLLSDVICETELSSEAEQVGVLGVFVRRYQPSTEWAPASMLDDDRLPVAEWAGWCATHDLAVINAVGEGCINVCGQGGNIAKGDLLCASDVPGKAMKQADNIVRNYSVARAREDVTFDDPADQVQIACVYGCG